MMSNKLEENIIDLANHWLSELRSRVGNPISEREKEIVIDLGESEYGYLSEEVSRAWIRLGVLTDIGQLSDSGLSDHAINKLSEIEKEGNRLIRTFSYMYTK
ncbi:hypothetical protein A3715_19275 [Oleiphilus sp. HI0009]|nr:hypothetical protein A3715_19275 [Oleiphilus sp. HI0009]